MVLPMNASASAGSLSSGCFLQPNVSDMEQTAYDAADFVVEELNRRKVEALFEDTIDLAKDEL